MFLDTVNKSIAVVLGESKTTTDCDITTAFSDGTKVITTGVSGAFNTVTAFIDGSFDAVSNGINPVTIVVPPAAGISRRVKQISIFNNDTISHNVTVRYIDGVTIRILWESILAAGQLLYYGDETWNAPASASESAEAALYWTFVAG